MAISIINIDATASSALLRSYRNLLGTGAVLKLHSHTGLLAGLYSLHVTGNDSAHSLSFPQFRLTMNGETQDPSNITGNASEDLKRFLSSPVSIFLGKGPGSDRFFGAPIIKRMTVKEVSVVDKSEEPSKREGRVVCELVTEEGASHLSFNLIM